MTALPKPDGGLEPYGFQIIFNVSVDPEIAPGVYPSQLAGSERDGRTAFEPAGAPVGIYPAGSRKFIYLPLILAPPRTDGPWYLSEPKPVSPGAIAPTDFLKATAPDLSTLAATAEITTINLAGEALTMAVAEEAGLGAVILADGRLEIIDLADWQARGTIFVGPKPQAILAGAPGSGSVYVSLENQIALIDLQTGQVVRRWFSPGRWRGLARDKATHRLFVADAEHERLLVLTDDLSQQLAELPLDQQPDQLIFDPTQRRLYLAMPAVPEIIAIDADRLVMTARTSLAGGPGLDLKLDAARGRLYALGMLGPLYRGIAVLDTPNLQWRSLVAGAGDYPLQSAAAITLTPDGQLLVPEINGLWQISTDEFAVKNLEPGRDLSPVGSLVVQKSANRIFMLEPLQKLVSVYQ